MDELQPTKELSKIEISLPDQTENNVEDGEQSLSPRRQSSSESENTTSPAAEEMANNMNNTHSSDDNSESEEHTSNVSDMNGNITDSDVVNRTSSNVVVGASLDHASFTCKYPGCNFISSDAEAYLKHEDTHVDGGSAFCDICNVRFPTYADMRRHHLYMHQGIRTFECQFCTKRFLRKEQFLEHLVHHTRPRPYQCSFCGLTFNFRTQLKSHLTTEHSQFIDKSCHLCDFKASSPNAVKQHYATFHLKQNLEISSNNRPQDLIRHVQVNPNDNGAIDLAAVSQNFSFMTAHYQPYLSRDASTMLPGPSDLSRASNLSLHSTGPHNYLPQSLEPTVNVPVHEKDRHTGVSSLACLTSVVSPKTGPGTDHSRRVSQDKVSVKPEPPELIVDDSQSSNVQPTSTMDLSTSDVVGTTCVTSNEAEVPCKRKIHKHSCTDETDPENQCQTSNRQCSEAQTGQTSMKTTHTCCRFRPYEDSGSQRCREYSRHTCLGHRNGIDRRSRFSDSDLIRGNTQNEQSDDDRKVFYSRVTPTMQLLGPSEAHIARVNNTAAIQNEGNAEHQAETNYYSNRKDSIIIRDIESCTLTCVYCNIIFPDQTLYLLHRSLHSESNHWKCNLCGKTCKDKYDFNSHIISKGHY